jgi:hypothetical protein
MDKDALQQEINRLLNANAEAVSQGSQAAIIYFIEDCQKAIRLLSATDRNRVKKVR